MVRMALLFCQAVPGDDSRRRGEGRNDEEKERYACLDSRAENGYNAKDNVTQQQIYVVIQIGHGRGRDKMMCLLGGRIILQHQSSILIIKPIRFAHLTITLPAQQIPN